MAEPKRKSIKDLTDEQIVGRLQALLVNAAQGQRSLGDDRQFPKLRKELVSRATQIPSVLEAHPSVDSVLGLLVRYPTRQQKVEYLRGEFDLVLRKIEEQEPEGIDSANWTGVESRQGKLKVIRELLPLAEASVEGLIASLSKPGDNGGPVLDERVEAIEHLRQLHDKLGQLLKAADRGFLDDDLGEGLAAEVARYGKRAARSLRDDPVPYVTSSLLLGIFTACGFPGIGKHLSGVAMNMRKHSKS